MTWGLLAIVLGVSIGGVVFSFLLARWVLKHDAGSPEMQAISLAIKEGAEAFLRRQYKTIIIISLPFALLLFVGYGIIRGHKEFDPVASALELAFWIALSFIAGAISSLIAGYVGMWASIRSNIRVAAAAARRSLPDALKIALRGGAVSGIMVVSMSLLGIGGLFILMKFFSTADPIKIPLLIVGYGFGASFVALFAQLGGGIYTKAADVGADLVGKVEAGIPEDDPRNPAVIADQVGDNVGDCAGRGADLFESTAAENIGAMILGAAMASKVAGSELSWVVGVMLFPLVARAFGIIASIIGIMLVRAKSNDDDPMRALNKGYYVSVFLAMIGFFIASRWLLYHPSYPTAWINFFLCGVIGVLTSVAFVFITQYYTEDRYRPVKEIVKSSYTGPATNIITGLSVGFENTALPAIAIGVAIIASYYLGRATGLPDAGLFGTAVATMGMLSTAGFILAMDTFGPITDNAGGIAEMSHQPAEVRSITDKLDAVGNTTKALTKGYAIGSAGLAAFLLFSAYIDEVRNYGVELKAVDISKPEVFVAALIGAMLVFLFSGLAIRAVGRAAYYVINEVRRQFREKPGILQGTEKPEYGTCVDIVTKGALKEMIIPGLLPVIVPTITGIIFKLVGLGAESVASLLMVGTIAGILVATVFNNGGAAWDNAKKSIESAGQKRTEQHKAAVVGDTVGDPLKDTAGPSLHVLIKLLSTVTLVLAPLFI